MARHAGTEHYERVITAADVAAELKRIFEAMDQPSIDGVNSYFVSKTAREAGLTVALSGLGGDELFGGYRNTFRGVPRVMRAIGMARAIPGGAAVARAGIQGSRGPGAVAQGRRRARSARRRPPARIWPAGVCSRRARSQALVTPEVWQAATGGLRSGPAHRRPRRRRPWRLRISSPG